MVRAKLILDTSILVDLLRNIPEAQAWYRTMERSSLAITTVTLMEIFQGAMNKRDFDRLGSFTSRYLHLHLTRVDSEWALRQFKKFWLSDRIGINDCFIASVAARLEIPVYTVNYKDFAPLPNIRVIKPY